MTKASIPPQNLAETVKEAFERALQFVRDFTAGINRRELARLFEEETKGAVSVLAGQEPENRAKEDDLTRTLRMVKDFFLGLALRLSPGRRLLFTVSLLLPVLGIFDVDVSLGAYRLFIDVSPIWFLASISGLTLLLALELVERLRVRDEVEVARQLQDELLPDADPPWPGYRVAHSYRTANTIGGDYYDFLELDDGRWAIAVGDASGHGIGAGLLMAIASASLRTAAELDPDPAAVLGLLDRTLARTGGRRAFMTLFYAVLDPSDGGLEFACAGHPFPLLRRSSGQLEELGEGALPLGLGRRKTYATRSSRLDPGDQLVLYSDGLPEACSSDDNAFGFDRLRALVVGGRSARHTHDRILEAIERHLGGRSLLDDLTLVVVERQPPIPPVPPPSQPTPSD